MLERVLEPEVMDSAEDAAAYDAIDNAAINEEFVAHALRLAPTAGAVLDAGAGPGDIAILLARRGPGLRVLAIDLGEHMLTLARRRVVRAGLAGRVEIVRADAKATGLPGAFDMIVSNSLVHHIPEPPLFFAEMQRVARAGAALLVKDLHRPCSEAEHRHLVETYAAECTPEQRRLFADSLRAALTAEEVAEICARVGLTDVTVRRTSDRHWCVERQARSPRGPRRRRGCSADSSW
jgi:ubiquinone/menaquinone biosynthesis C-methylase UbiE